MIRIAGRNLSEKKQIRFALTPIKGIGKSNVKTLLKALEIDINSTLADLSEELLTKLRNKVDEYLIEADLRRFETQNIKRLVDLGNWKGGRHKLGLPVNGQTTRTNSRTRRGKKVMKSPVKKKK
jgi:small subunit ribosomal protein S13